VTSNEQFPAPFKGCDLRCGAVVDTVMVISQSSTRGAR
jgi:hypothetical protein